MNNKGIQEEKNIICLNNRIIKMKSLHLETNYPEYLRKAMLNIQHF